MSHVPASRCMSPAGCASLLVLEACMGWMIRGPYGAQGRHTGGYNTYRGSADVHISPHVPSLLPCPHPLHRALLLTARCIQWEAWKNCPVMTVMITLDLVSHSSVTGSFTKHTLNAVGLIMQIVPLNWATLPLTHHSRHRLQLTLWSTYANRQTCRYEYY